MRLLTRTALLRDPSELPRGGHRGRTALFNLANREAHPSTARHHSEICHTRGPRADRFARSRARHPAVPVGSRGEDMSQVSAACGDVRRLGVLAVVAVLAALALHVGGARADGPGVGAPWVTSVGDSYI